MQRSWAYLFYDLALVAVAFFPLALVAAVASGRSAAAAVYALAFAGVISSVLVVDRVSKLKMHSYWRSFTSPVR